MDDLSINYFDDLEFVCHGETAVNHLFYIRDFSDYWGIQFSRRGRISLKIDGNPTEYANGTTLFFTFPGSHFEYGAADDSGIENKIYICFRGERVRRYVEGGLLTPRYSSALLSPNVPDELLARLRRLRALILLSENAEKHALAVLELEGLLLQVRTGLQKSGNLNNIHYQEFAALTEHITASPEADWDFAREARRLSISLAHFRRLFEQFFSIPPGAFLLKARFDKAAELLTGTSLSIQEIAHECGFEDEFYFSRCFRRHRGMAPKFYRKNFRND